MIEEVQFQLFGSSDVEPIESINMRRTEPTADDIEKNRQEWKATLGSGETAYVRVYEKREEESEPAPELLKVAILFRGSQHFTAVEVTAAEHKELLQACFPVFGYGVPAKHIQIRGLGVCCADVVAIIPINADLVMRGATPSSFPGLFEQFFGKGEFKI